MYLCWDWDELLGGQGLTNKALDVQKQTAESAFWESRDLPNVNYFNLSLCPLSSIDWFTLHLNHSPLDPPFLVPFVQSSPPTSPSSSSQRKRAPYRYNSTLGHQGLAWLDTCYPTEVQPGSACRGREFSGREQRLRLRQPIPTPLIRWTTCSPSSTFATNVCVSEARSSLYMLFG